MLEVCKMHEVERMLLRFPQKRLLLGWMEVIEQRHCQRSPVMG